VCVAAQLGALCGAVAYQIADATQSRNRSNPLYLRSFGAYLT
jgi:hypothetical protein